MTNVERLIKKLAEELAREQVPGHTQLDVMASQNCKVTIETYSAPMRRGRA